MATSLEDKLDRLDDDRRARSGTRAAELIAAEVAERELRPTEASDQPRARGQY